mgnify:CR=1 FL=1
MFDFLDYVWYKLFGLDLMLNGNHRIFIFVGFVVVVVLILEIATSKDPFLNNWKTIAITFIILCSFAILLFATIHKVEYKILNKEEMVLIKPNEKSITAEIKDQFSTSENFIKKDASNNDVIKLDNSTLYLGGELDFDPHHFPSVTITISKNSESIDKTGRLIIEDPSGTVLETSEVVKVPLKIKEIYYGDLTYDLKVGSISEIKKEKFVKVVVDNSKLNQDKEDLKKLLNEE